MAFGDDALGSVPIGTPPEASEDPVINARQKALYYEAKTRDYPIDEETGRYLATDKATAACQLALFHLRGRIAAAPDTGNTLDLVEQYSQRAQSDTDNRIRDALEPIARRGWISNIRVRMQPVPSGGLKVEVIVFNHFLDRDIPLGVT